MSYRKDTDFGFEPTKNFSHIYNLVKSKDFISRTRIENYGGLANRLLYSFHASLSCQVHSTSSMHSTSHDGRQAPKRFD